MTIASCDQYVCVCVKRQMFFKLIMESYYEWLTNTYVDRPYGAKWAYLHLDNSLRTAKHIYIIYMWNEYIFAPDIYNGHIHSYLGTMHGGFD